MTFWDFLSDSGNVHQVVSGKTREKRREKERKMKGERGKTCLKALTEKKRREQKLYNEY